MSENNTLHQCCFMYKIEKNFDKYFVQDDSLETRAQIFYTITMHLFKFSFFEIPSKLTNSV